MRQRSISAVGVVVVGLVPGVLGGWLFGVVFTALCALAYLEAIRITQARSSVVTGLGLAIVVLGGLLPLVPDLANRAGLFVAIAVGLPLGSLVFSRDDTIASWSATTATSLYLGLPAFAAVSIRNEESFPARDWIRSLAGVMPDVDSGSGGGLAWLLLVLLVTWLSDTFAYLVGKTWGRRKLIPRVSPNKTVEGAAGGLTAALITAIICDAAFGMGMGVAWAAVIGVVLGGFGMIGDLSESMLKRQRGIKDSGTLIPGHGGMLDRIDALIFILVAAWLIAPAFG